MRVAIVGAGAIGCFLGARLQERGHDVTLVGRHEQVEAISRNGLSVEDRYGDERRYELRAAESLTVRPDLVLLTVKSQDVTEACASIRAHVQGVPVVAMQNGLRGDELAAHVLGKNAIAGAVVMCAASYLQPGRVSVQFPGWLILGEPFGRAGPRTRGIARVLSDAVPVYVTRHLARVRWSKLISNLNNGISAATGNLLADVLTSSMGRALPVKLMREGYDVMRAAGVGLDRGLYGLTPRALRHDPNAGLIAILQATMTTALAVLPEQMAVRVLSAAGRSSLNRLPIRGSTWQSIARGRPTEIDFLNGEIVRRGQKLGIPTPFNERVVEMVHQVERSGKFCGVEDLLPHGIPGHAGLPAAWRVN